MDLCITTYLNIKSIVGRLQCALMVALVFLFGLAQTEVHAQTAGGTQISIQATGSYSYKSRAFSVSSPTVTVTVANLPNFELHYAVKDSNVIFNDVVKLWLVFKNVGNAPVDTVTIQSTLPSSGISVVSISDNGVLNGNQITWQKFNYPSARQDSFLIQIKIDTTTAGQTQLMASATLSWQGKVVAATQSLIVGNFARLSLTNSTVATVVGSGRTIDYQLQVTNTGNVKSDSTVLVDTISAPGFFLRADVPPTSISANKLIVTWNLGTLQPVTGQKKISVTVQTLPNLGSGLLKNVASVRSSTVPSVSAGEISTPVVRVRPAAITLAPQPAFIFGALNQDSSDVVVTVADSLGNPIPDGVPVTFTTDFGLFSNGTRSIATATTGGKTEASLIAEDVHNVIRTATITATAGGVQSGTITGQSTVTLYPGAVTGVVHSAVRVGNDVQQVPYSGAIAQVINDVQQVVAADTTEADGVFFIALNKQLIKFTLKILVIDQFGDTSSTTSSISSDTLFGKKAVKILNTISGRLEYMSGNAPVPVQDVEVYLDSLTTGSSPVMSPARVRSAPAPFVAHRMRTTRTDALGRYKFQGLQPAVYRLSVDSVAFPNFSGATTLYDTVGGAFTINLNIQVQPNASASLAMATSPTAFAGDTLKYWMKFENQGNVTHTHVSLIDTLPRFTSLAGQQQGIYKSVSFDTAQGIVTWAMDSLKIGIKDSVWMRLATSRNIPDSSRIVNTSWLASTQLAPRGSSTGTLVRSAPVLTLKHFVLQSRDTIVAGDSVGFLIWYSNTGTDSIRNVVITDSIANGGKSVVMYTKWTGAGAGKDTTALDSVITWPIGSIPPGRVDSFFVTMKTDYSLEYGRKIRTKAYVLQNSLPIASSSASVLVRNNPQFSNFLLVEKSGDKNVAEVGDVVTYQVKVTNNSTGLLKEIKIIDQLPHAFKYYGKSARYNGVPVEPAVVAGGSILQWTLANVSKDSLKAGSVGILVYQLVLGADALESQGLNTVYATAKDTLGSPLVSLPAHKQVTVRPGVFTDRGVVIGKVFYDDDRNSYQSEGEVGVKGVEIWMEDGTRILTGDDGKFSLPDVKPGQHVLRVNERTLPSRTELLLGKRDFAGDATSRFVRLTEGGIARANFFVKRVLKDSIYQKVGKVSKAAALRTATPEKVYLRDVPASSQNSNTVEFRVRLNYSGATWLQRIQVIDQIPSGFTYIEGSGIFNGRKVAPIANGQQLTWQLGRGAALFEGSLSYRVSVESKESQETGLESSSLVQLMTADSAVIQSDTLRTTTSVQKISFTEKSFPVEQLLFNTGRSTLRKDALSVFKPIMDIIRQNRFADVMVVGYPDIPVKRGSSLPVLQKLAEERAKVALDFLTRRMKLDSVRISACSVFRCDTSKDVLAGMMSDSPDRKATPRHLEIRVQDYFLNALNTRDTRSSISLTSLVRSAPIADVQFTDSLVAIPGDELVFRYALFSNPSASMVEATLFDSTASSLSIIDETLAMNEVPLISASPLGGILVSTITPLVKKGKNEIRFTAVVQPDTNSSKIDHLLYFERINAFGEQTVVKSNLVKIMLKPSGLSLIQKALNREKELTETASTRKPTSSK